MVDRTGTVSAPAFIANSLRVTYGARIEHWMERLGLRAHNLNNWSQVLLETSRFRRHREYGVKSEGKRRLDRKANGRRS